MKIKHVAILLIPLALLGLWSSSRLYIVYSASISGININDDYQPLPITVSDHFTTLRPANKMTAKPISAPNDDDDDISTKIPITPSPITPPTAKPVTITIEPTTSTQPPKQVTRKQPLFDVSKDDPHHGESFSACLKWMDDYRQLGEWLAYHYHVLPLRYLVFFRDPKSWTDPQPILDKWSHLIQFEYWTNNSDFMTPDQEATIEHMTIDTKKHRRAQRFFYHSCLNHLATKNRTWTILMDTDEYLILDSNNIPNVSERLLQPGAALDIIHKAQAKDPSIVQKNTPTKWMENCTVMARKEYPAFESPRQKVYANIPTGIDAYRFVTLRFRHRGQKLIGKSMVDISTLDMSKIGWKDVYSHNLFDSCNKGNNKGDLMYVAHYLGSMEAYQRPADRRNDWMNRTKKFYKLNAKSHNHLDLGKGDAEVRPWMQGFVNNVGMEQAKYLLEGVGFPYNATTALQVMDETR